MKRTIQAIAIAVIATICSQTAAKAQSGSKLVTITCGQGQRSSAQGNYGGAGFGVACPGGGKKQVIVPSGTAWNMRIGVEDQTAAYDCFFSGDSPTVSVNCVGTIVTIQ